MLYTWQRGSFGCNTEYMSEVPSQFGRDISVQARVREFEISIHREKEG